MSRPQLENYYEARGFSVALVQRSEGGVAQAEVGSKVRRGTLRRFEPGRPHQSARASRREPLP